jgi:hypothetical protein
MADERLTAAGISTSAASCAATASSMEVTVVSARSRSASVASDFFRADGDGGTQARSRTFAEYRCRIWRWAYYWTAALMIWIAPLLMLLVFVTIEIHVLRLVDGDAHERCLKNIGRLESELFPDLPSELRWAPWPPRSSVRSRPAIWTRQFARRRPAVAANYVQMVMPQGSRGAAGTTRGNR